MNTTDTTTAAAAFAYRVPCPTCQAPANVSCGTRNGRKAPRPHVARVDRLDAMIRRADRDIDGPGRVQVCESHGGMLRAALADACGGAVIERPWGMARTLCAWCGDPCGPLTGAAAVIVRVAD